MLNLSLRVGRAVNNCAVTKPGTTYRTCSSRIMVSAGNTGFCFADCDVIGFDLDHTLAEYRLPNLFSLIYKNMAEYLIKEKGYSEELRQPYETGKYFIQKGIVFDKQRGNFLKLSSDYTIIKATHGTKVLSKDQLLRTYGNQRIWDKSLELPEGLCHPDSHKKPYYVFRDYFVLPVALVCARLIDCIDKENDKPTEYSPLIWQDVFDGVVNLYRRDNFQEEKTGTWFFGELVSDPSKYLVPCSERLLNWLWNVKQRKRVFLLTSAYIDAASFTAEFCLGRDWKKYFDVCITFARKPSFFTTRRPFLALNGTKEGDMISGDELRLQEVYSQGNWLELQSFFGRLLQKQKPNVLYVGDSIIEDIFAPSNYTSCKSIAVVEEIRSEGTDVLDHEVADFSSEFWGSFFICEDIEHSQGIKKTLWNEVIINHSKIAIPDLDSLSCLPIDNRIPPYEKDKDFAFYPSPPYKA